MKLISHRGNVFGRKPLLENSPDYINSAISLGYDVEVDVWLCGDKFFLGHDKPQFEIKTSFLKNRRLWCHAKNIPALLEMSKNNIHCFWHQKDDVTLTSRGFLWTFPGKILTNRSICVCFEREKPTEECYGICSDFVGELNE